ncbi:DUF445 domain-containing protein [Tomitella biformata]|uniref:DUF445 domain-containing protein n=1 Tax=Tomitella biformata TaxID=630403 RepID=UPI0006878C4D|nr:DUF445 family protein [Tomitella biformata]
MKLVATGFLVGVTLVYLLCLLSEGGGEHGWVSYVKSAAEAGMVGGLADWFAVTALFRHPLGIPIPHTAIIRKKKDQIGESLGSFVGENFLAPEAVLGKLESARIPERVGTWMAQPRNAERVAAEASTLALGLVTVLKDDDVQQIIDATIVRRLAEPAWGPPIGKVLEELLKEDRQLPIIEMLCERAYEWALGSQETIDRVITRDSPTWSPKFVDMMVGEKIHREIVEFTWKVRSDPQHEIRQAMNAFLVDFARDLQNDPATMAKAEKVKAELMGRKEIATAAEAAWRIAKKLIEDSVRDPSSTLRTKFVEYSIRIGERLRDDPAARGKVDRWLSDGARYVVENYSGEITSVITDTVARWDGEEASRKIEVQAGRDLQFIRINGTVVGALAGLVIHVVSQVIVGG